MTKRNRKILAENFVDGKMPTQEAFGDLIDSMVNIVDDGFDKSARDGMKVAQVDNGSKLISFYDEITVKDPLWTISFTIPGYGENTEGRKNLNFFGGGGKSGFTLSTWGNAEKGEEKVRVWVNKGNPDYEMDVGGVLAADGRIGRKGKESVRADGKWHPIVTGLDGCHAFEVMAGVGKRHSGRYALLHAFALSTFNSGQDGITSHQAHFSSKCDQIELRWAGETHNYSLEMRTRCSYEQKASEKVFIRYYLTRLWFDPFMEDCSEDDDSAEERGGYGK